MQTIYIGLVYCTSLVNHETQKLRVTSHHFAAEKSCIMISSLSSWFQTMLDFVFPAACVYCHKFVGDDRILIFCQSCWSTMPLISESVCPRCGTPYSSHSVLQYAPEFLCGDCRTAPPFFDRACAAASYEGVIKEAIHQFKFHQKTGLGKPLAQALISRIPTSLDISQYQAILPVPLHKTRQRQRGYNQSAILARHLARHYGLRVLGHKLLRTRPTNAQAQMKGRKERQENVKNAFSVRSPEVIRDQNLILIDDVLTTGATMNECAKVLKQAGAASILVLTLSRVCFQYNPNSEQKIS